MQGDPAKFMVFANSFSSKAFLLKKIEYGEYDAILTFFTEESGKLKAFARSAKKSKKRFGTSLDLLILINAHFSHPKKEDSLYILDSTSIIQMFANIRKDLHKIAAASYILELFYEMTAENVKNRNLFHFLYSFLTSLDENALKLSHLPLYGIKFLRMIGLGPNFLECVICGKPKSAGKWFFRSDKGGIVCSACPTDERSGEFVLSAETLNILAKEQEMEEGFLQRVFPSKNSAKELVMVVDRFIQYNLGKRLNSLKFMEELNGQTSVGI